MTDRSRPSPLTQADIERAAHVTRLWEERRKRQATAERIARLVVALLALIAGAMFGFSL